MACGSLEELITDVFVQLVSSDSLETRLLVEET
jgi:hypothetical protein